VDLNEQNAVDFVELKKLFTFLARSKFSFLLYVF